MPADVYCHDCGCEFDDADEFDAHDCEERDDDPDGGGAKAVLADGGSDYAKTDAIDVEDAWKTTHDNGDETYVVVLDAGASCVVSALDLDDEGVLLEREDISSPLTSEEADAMAQQWMTDNPKGILGSDDNDGGGLAGIFGGDD